MSLEKDELVINESYLKALLKSLRDAQNEANDLRLEVKTLREGISASNCPNCKSADTFEDIQKTVFCKDCKGQYVMGIL